MARTLIECGFQKQTMSNKKIKMKGNHLKPKKNTKNVQ